jgi:uncharacterized protein with LGFP repeats
MSDEKYGARGGGSYQFFEGGKIYNTGKSSVMIKNAFASRWDILNNEWGWLGYPTSDTVCNTKNTSCYQFFENGNAMYLSEKTGLHTIGGGIYKEWDKTGKEWGRLGYPTSDELYNQEGAYQTFEGGKIVWPSKTPSYIIYY